MKLKTNMRAKNDPEYAEMILDIGSGKTGEYVNVPDDMLLPDEKSLINHVFTTETIKWPLSEKRAILTVDNTAALEINKKVCLSTISSFKTK